MDKYTCRAHLRPFKIDCQSNNHRLSSHKTAWSIGQFLSHTKKAGENQQQKSRDFHSHNWRQHRHSDAGGFFMPVFYAISGFVPGSRGIQHGANRNKRVVYQLDDGRPRPFLPTSKNLTGVTAMTALNTVGVSRPLFPYGFPPRIPEHLRPPLPKKPKTLSTSRKNSFSFNRLTVRCSGKAHLFTLAGVPVAWVLEGHHKGQQNNQRKRVEFVDVVYLRQTQHGANLETRDFERLGEALAFVYGLFEQGGES